MSIDQLFENADVYAPPVKRAAYSDRTAWLMSAMAELAYFRFEGGKSLPGLAKDIALAKDEAAITKLLKGYLDDVGTPEQAGRDRLASVLNKANFKLVNVYNEGGTQAFLAKMTNDDGSDGMLVLSFRGTELQEKADIWADLKADLTPIGGSYRVHRGFRDAFGKVEEEISNDLKSHQRLPLYITGHSLGGALAILATSQLASDSLGACYTFGGPRVGESKLADNIKTPIYRIVNAADGVPRLPPSFVIDAAIEIVKWVPIPHFAKWIADGLTRFKGYAHYGDMRYLTHVDAVEGSDQIAYSGLRLINNPAMSRRVAWTVPRWLKTRGKAAIEDHSMEVYREKLMAYAQRRNKT